MASLMSQLVPLTEDQSIEELNLALDSQRDLRHSVDPSGPDFGAFLDYEGQISYLKYKKTDDLKNLDEALRVTRAALETNTAPGYKLGVIQCRLAGYLTLMMADTGNQQYAKEALTYGRLALKSLDIACEQWWAAITNLSELFQDLGPSSIVLEELDEVIEIYLTGLDMARRRTNYSSRYFGGLSALLGLRYKQTHSPQDLEKSIDYGYEAIDMIKFADTVTGEYDWLSAILLQNYQSTHSSSSLSEALRISYDDPGSNSEARRATRVNSGAFCNRGIILSELSKRCRDRDPTEALKLLDEAIFNGNSAIALLKPEDDHYPHVLNMMGAWHAERMQVANNPEFGEEGIRVLKRALALRPRDHPEYARVLGNLAHIRQVQFQILQDRGKGDEASKALDEAIEYGHDSIKHTKGSDLDLGQRNYNIAKMICSKAIRNGDRQLLQQSRKYFEHTANMDDAALLHQIPCSMQAGLFYNSDGNLMEANKLFQRGIRLLPQLNPHSISRQDLQQTLSQISGLATFAASNSLMAGLPPFEALKSLEEARCVIAGLSMRSNADISQLEDINIDLANRYNTLRARLIQVSRDIKAPGLYYRARKEQQEVLASISKVEAEIREQPGWDSFQLPMSAENVMALASDGPIIVVNATKLQCDAIVVTMENIQHIKLEKMDYNTLEYTISRLNSMGNEDRRNAVPRQVKSDDWSLANSMLWLWNVAVKPILDNVKLTSSKRVWWITTGLAGRAPFHAAGDHTVGSDQNTHSRVISSYISSFRALRFARERQNMAIDSTYHKMLLITMSSNPKPHHNLNTSHEEQVANEIFGSSMVHLSHPSPDEVLKELPCHNLVHFACHGSSISYDPSQSGLLLLGKNREAVMLTISDLEKVDLKSASIAYLSACSTAEQVDGKFADEALHLANSFQALGYQHVVGSMWGADDIAAGEIAKRFYEEVFERGHMERSRARQLDVAAALHHAVRDYKNAVGGQDIARWAPFVHFGS